MAKAQEKTWLIADGEYSDYSIIGVVVGTEAHAEAVAARVREQSEWHRGAFVQPTTLYRQGEFPEPITFHSFTWFQRDGHPATQQSRSVTVLECDGWMAPNTPLPTPAKPLQVKVQRKPRRVDVNALDFHEGKARFDVEVAKLA